MKFLPFIFLFLLVVTTVSAYNFVSDETEVFFTTYSYTINITNLSQMLDVNVTSPSDNDALVYSSSSGKWENIAGLTDTNETTRIEAMVAMNCSTGYQAIGLYTNGTFVCAADSMGNNHLHDQDLNTTDDVVFNSVNVTTDMNITGTVYVSETIIIAQTNFICLSGDCTANITNNGTHTIWN